MPASDPRRGTDPFGIPIFEDLASWRSDPRRREAGGAPGGLPVREAVAGIIERVRRDGDRALLELAARFDGMDMDAAALRVSRGELAKLAAAADPEERALLRRTRDRIAAYHERQREESFRMDLGGGSSLSWRILPLASVGVYVPGGRAVYPSTVLMNTVPARIAGVPRIALATPPGALERSPILAAAVEAAGVSEVYRMGGAQAVAAFALGTAAVTRVRKVVGPGNAFVAEAKRQLTDIVGTDAIAGPSEVVVLADAAAPPAWVAADLLAQAEHGSGEERAILVTTSRRLAEAVAAQIRRQAADQPNREAIAAALALRGAVILAPDLEAAAAICEELAPEHLEVMTADPEALAHRLPGAGALLLGPWAAVAAGDYGVGPNHVLPTGGTARFSSPLSVADFRKRQSVVRLDREALAARRSDFEAFARIEGFEAHARSIAIRFTDEPRTPETS